MPAAPKRPMFFENWLASVQDKNEAFAGYECPLYSDVWITGEEKIGPYHFINTSAHGGGHREDAVAPVIVLRVSAHVEDELPPMDKTDISLYHGGTLSDEAAALAALSLGIRVTAGPTTREFFGGDSLGRPVAHFGYAPPVLPVGDGGPRLPRGAHGHNLEGLRLIGGLDASAKDQVALIRAARLYQQALWVADAEPALAWLLFVSAVETAADRWDQSRGSNAERLRDSKPALVELIEAKCPAILQDVADALGDSIGATRKFVAFVLNFLPQPPEVRPPSGFRISWDAEQLRPMLRTIYGYRSKALHTGVPFPAPMCEAPRRLSSAWPGVNEKPPGLATGTLGGVWLQQDTPMMLHVFEYIVRGVLQAWWSSVASAASCAST